MINKEKTLVMKLIFYYLYFMSKSFIGLAPAGDQRLLEIFRAISATNVLGILNHQSSFKPRLKCDVLSFESEATDNFSCELTIFFTYLMLLE